MEQEASAVGGVKLVRHTCLTADEVATLMSEGFAVEHRSWKGDAGTSVLGTEGALDFYTQQARHLAILGHLELVYLYFGDRPIAFVYAWKSRGCRYCVKLGYDEEFRRFGPGQQMIMQWLEALHLDEECRLFDFWGRSLPWNECWATSSYPVGRVLCVPRASVRHGLIAAYKTCGASLSRFPPLGQA